MKIYVIFLALLLIGIASVSANGLIINKTSYEVTKSYGSDYIVNISITNTEPYSFYNISLDGGSVLKMANIPQLDSGATSNTQITVTSNDNLNQQFRIKGFYYSNIGQQNITHQVTVNAYSSTPCSFSIVRGDSIIWTSTIQNTINLKEYPSNAPVDASTITSGQPFGLKYNIAGSKTYQWFVGSWGFGELCTITILPETGYVNDPTLDGLVNFNISTSYVPTTITAQLFKTNYTIDFFVGDEGTVFITNTGSNIAKNIHLNGDWFTFDANDFDLNPGYSKSVNYNIIPYGLTTNDTNKSYNKELQIAGNFPTLIQNFSIFINYADMGNGSISNSSNFLQWVCTNYPDLCKPQIIYKYVTNGSGSMQINITADQWRDYNLDLQNEKTARQTLYNYIKSQDDLYSNSLNQTSAQIAEMNSTLVDMDVRHKDDIQNQQVAWIVIVCIIIFVLMIFIGIYIYYRKMRKSRWL